MNEKWQAIYEVLSRDIDLLRGSGSPGLPHTEACFKCCLDHWSALKKMVLRDLFEDEREEILFFKYVKPKFTGQLEYFTQIYQFQLFCPVDDAAQLKTFIKHEQWKIDQFKINQKAFIKYYVSGQNGLDARFFLRRNFEAKPSPNVCIYDLDPRLLTTGDWMLTLLMSYEQYDRFLKNVLRTLENIRQSDP